MIWYIFILFRKSYAFDICNSALLAKFFHMWNEYLLFQHFSGYYLSLPFGLPLRIKQKRLKMFWLISGNFLWLSLIFPIKDNISRNILFALFRGKKYNTDPEMKEIMGILKENDQLQKTKSGYGSYRPRNDFLPE